MTNDIHSASSIVPLPLWLPEDELALHAEAQNNLLLQLATRKTGKPRPVSLRRDEIISCGLGQLLDDPSIVFVPLGGGLWTAIDAEDALRICRHRWSARRRSDGNGYYVQRTAKGRLIHLHREILPCPDGAEPDHISNDGLDNRRSNLRLATHRQNIVASRRSLSKGFRGVSKIRGKWQARIRKDGRLQHLGTFATPQAAAAAYDFATLQANGNFAVTNFSPIPTTVQ
jgi:hypothetical protein